MKNAIKYSMVGLLFIAMLGLAIAGTTTITDDGVSTFGGDLILGVTDSKIEIHADEKDVSSEGSSIELYADNPEAKPYLAWYGWYDKGLGAGVEQNQVGWFGCHYNTSITPDVHQHCSFEVPDDTGLMQTRWGLTYGLDNTEMNLKFSNINYVDYSDGVDIRFDGGDDGSIEYKSSTNSVHYETPGGFRYRNFEGEEFVIHYYSGPSISDVENNTEIRIYGESGAGTDYLRLLNDGTNSEVRSNRGDLILSGRDNTEEVVIDDSDLRLSGSADIKADADIILKPDASSTDYLTIKLYDGDTTVGITGTGTDKIIISDGLDVRGEVNIDGIDGDGTGKVVCIKSDGDLGTCTDAPNASGVCTCS